MTLTACLLSCSRFCFLRLAMLAPPAAAYIASRVAGSLPHFPSQGGSVFGAAPVSRYELRRIPPMIGPCHSVCVSRTLVLSRREYHSLSLFFVFLSLFPLPLWKGKKRNGAPPVLWRPSLRSTSLNRYVTSMIKSDPLYVGSNHC